ncbi:hypothetical protein G6F37_000032 [Rhizopus arrhizus]|nr:hypothetical protein G6F38_006663 [Rhizopus arrhizus]KAG1164691.1 hypothetical protein G6F37_000032 [Rhizopus arrhizus]
MSSATQIKDKCLLIKQNAFSYNPIQLAAISNFKLAQLTFAPPNLHSLRKTAIVKNMLENVYSITPPEYLQQMTRWQFFTPESLEEMTQEGLEEIFAQYAQTIEAFRDMNIIPHYEDNKIEKENMWTVKDEQEKEQEEQEEDDESKKTYSTGSSCSSIFSQPNTTISAESLEARGPYPLSDKPLPANPVDDVAKQARRKSGFSGNKNRLSWTSDTGVTSSVVSQNLANEIMSLFDMDFAVDIKIDTAPKLPELPFKPTNKVISQRRPSQDMLTSLLPAFEKIAFEHSAMKSQLNQKLCNQQKQTSTVIQSVPKRSSSLKHRQEQNKTKTPARSRTTDDYNIQQPLIRSSSIQSNMDSSSEKALSKKKSILRLASLVTGGNKKQQVDNNNATHSSDTSNTLKHTNITDLSEPEKFSIRDKPLPEPPNSPGINPIIHEEFICNSKKPKVRTKKKRKSAVVMEKTMSKRKSNQAFQSIYDDINDSDKRPSLKKSKSAFIKLGGGLKSKTAVPAKQVRRVSSAKEFTRNSLSIEYEKSKNIYSSEDTSNHNFVKRMASFMKPRGCKPVEI